MYQTFHVSSYVVVSEPSFLTCDWRMLRARLLLQWKRLTARELDGTGPDRNRIALLVERKYGIAHELVENYLRNIERTI